MTSPQDPPRRRKQKARRSKQLAAWREKNAATKATTSQASQAAPVTKASKVSEGTKAAKKA